LWTERRRRWPASRTHNFIQGELNRLIGNHLLARGDTCVVLPNPGVVPPLRSEHNFRVPDLAVTCTPCQQEEYVVDPVLIIEILSPSNQAETWTNIWAYTTIPSVQEIPIVRSTEIGAALLRRDAKSDWPESSLMIEDGVLELRSIGFQVKLPAPYRGTRLAPD